MFCPVGALGIIDLVQEVLYEPVGIGTEDRLSRRCRRELHVAIGFGAVKVDQALGRPGRDLASGAPGRLRYLLFTTSSCHSTRAQFTRH